MSDVETANDRIWIQRPRYTPTTPSSSSDGGPGGWIPGYSEISVETLTGIRAGHFESASTVTRRGASLIPEREGTRFVIEGLNDSPSRLVVVDTTDAAHPVDILERLENRAGYYMPASAITLDDRYLIWSMGKNGAMAIPLN